MRAKFAEGDKVRVVGDCPGVGLKYVGQTGVVFMVDDHESCPCLVKVEHHDGGRISLYFPPTSLELTRTQMELFDEI